MPETREEYTKRKLTEPPKEGETDWKEVAREELALIDVDEEPFFLCGEAKSHDVEWTPDLAEDPKTFDWPFDGVQVGKAYWLIRGNPMEKELVIIELRHVKGYEDDIVVRFRDGYYPSKIRDIGAMNKLAEVTGQDIWDLYWGKKKAEALAYSCD
jgi:hypothetical protein